MTDNGDRRRAVRSFSAIAEWADAALERRGTLLRSCFYPKNEYGHPYLRAVDENGNVTHGIGSKDYEEYIAYLKERES